LNNETPRFILAGPAVDEGIAIRQNPELGAVHVTASMQALLKPNMFDFAPGEAPGRKLAASFGLQSGRLLRANKPSMVFVEGKAIKYMIRPVFAGLDRTIQSADESSFSFFALGRAGALETISASRTNWECDRHKGCALHKSLPQSPEYQAMSDHSTPMPTFRGATLPSRSQIQRGQQNHNRKSSSHRKLQSQPRFELPLLPRNTEPQICPKRRSQNYRKHESGSVSMRMRLNRD
jgi:hypothetical protein